MTSWDQLAEARIQEWLHRPAEQRGKATEGDAPNAPLEVQLIQDVLGLYAEAAAAQRPAAKDAALKLASELASRLFIILEKSDRPLAAQHFAELLQRSRGRYR